jgi:hypothetical protein
MLAPPVGSSPSSRAVAFVCVVTSPNEVEHFPHGLCRNLEWQSTALSLIRGRHFLCQEKSATRGNPNSKLETGNSKFETRYPFPIPIIPARSCFTFRNVLISLKAPGSGKPTECKPGFQATRRCLSPARDHSLLPWGEGAQRRRADEGSFRGTNLSPGLAA